MHQYWLPYSSKVSWSLKLETCGNLTINAPSLNCSARDEVMDNTDTNIVQNYHHHNNNNNNNNNQEKKIKHHTPQTTKQILQIFTNLLYL